MKTDTISDSKEGRQEPTNGLSIDPCTLILDYFEYSWFKVIKITGQRFFKMLTDTMLGVNRSRIGNRPCTADWHHEL